MRRCAARQESLPQGGARAAFGPWSFVTTHPERQAGLPLSIRCHPAPRGGGRAGAGSEGARNSLQLQPPAGALYTSGSARGTATHARKKARRPRLQDAWRRETANQLT
jgi:hypothetical protein